MHYFSANKMLFDHSISVKGKWLFFLAVTNLSIPFLRYCSLVSLNCHLFEHHVNLSQRDSRRKW